MVSGTRCPSVRVCSDVVNGRGAAAPEGQMTYDSTQDDFPFVCDYKCGYVNIVCDLL